MLGRTFALGMLVVNFETPYLFVQNLVVRVIQLFDESIVTVMEDNES